MKRLLVLLLLLPSLLAGAQGGGITLDVKNAPLRQVLASIEDQADYIFLYKGFTIDLDRTVTVSFESAGIETVLARILDDETGYVLNGRQVSLFHKEKKAVEKTPEKQTRQEAPAPKPSVSGSVRDRQGLGVIGAFVMEQGTKSGTVTDVNGNYSLTLTSQSAVLEVSCLGYATVVEPVGGKSHLDIVMNEDIEQISEVVVVGYGVQRKESVVGAIAQIGTESIVNTGMTNVTQAIAGKLSGVLTMQTQGTPGDNNATILVRGVSSWNGSAPLVMVDGVERDFSSIDPNEIASVSVLKDASATAVFGAKGANGVILVTTRGGHEGKPRMNLSVSYGLNIPARLPHHISAYDTASGWNVAMMNEMNYGSMYSERELQEFAHPSSAINSLRYPDVDWYKEMLKAVAQKVDANFNISGGTKKARYFISMGYKNEDSIFRNSELYGNRNYGYNRFNYRANIDFNVTKSTILSFKVGGDIGIRQAPATDPMRSLFGTSTISFPVNYPSWLLGEVPDSDAVNASNIRLVDSARSGSYFLNPYNALNDASYNKYTTSNLYTDLILKQDFGFLTEGLSLNAKFSFSTTMSRISEKVSASPIKYYFDWKIYDEGTGNPWLPESYTTNAVVEDPPYAATQGSINNYTYTLYWEASVNYDRTFNNHHVTALALFNQRQYRSKVAFPYRNQGVVARVTYGYKNKYLFEANLGVTGSEQFAPSNRYGVFPSVAVGYVISEEKFWKDHLPWWTKMKLRYSDGFVGNDQTGNRWLYYSAFSISDPYSKFITGKTSVIEEDSAANTSAKWEKAHKRDIGIEMSWLKDRLSLNVDLFDEHRSQMLVDRKNNTTALVGTSFKPANLGSMKKHGLEVEAGWSDRLSNGFSYNVNAMYSFNENRILNYEDAAYAPDYQKTAGKAWASQTSGNTLVDSGYYTSVDDIHNYPSYTSGTWLTEVLMGSYKYLDYCVDGLIDKTDLHAVEGSRYPAHIYSFGGGFSYKGWVFNFLFYGNAGKYVEFNSNFILEFEKGDKRMSLGNSDYWTPDNPNAPHATLVNNGSGVSAHQMYGWAGGSSGSEGTGLALPGHTWRIANYLTLRDVYLGYTFDTNKIRNVAGIASVSLYLTGNNLLYFTPLIEGNPEATTFREGFYPLMRSVQFGLKLGF